MAMERNMNIAIRLAIYGTTALLSTSAIADDMPDERSLSRLQYSLINSADIYSYKALPNYSQAPFLDALVASGKLPALEKRLPKEPLVFKTNAMSDGAGEYGGVFRHVIGGRPQGWNWLAGQHQGWGGINMAIQECLVRQGPRWQVKAEDQTGPLPNLARSWQWSDDHKELTMNLVEGIKWSDGDAFDTEDIRFWWEDNVENKNVSSRLSAGALSPGATMEVIDDYSFKFIFLKPQSETLVESLSYIQGCPGPSHILKGKHPKYNKDATYSGYTSSLPTDSLNVPVLGAWVPVLHRPDELVVMRRNPFYWKVDETGKQLPYINEMHFKLSTWDDRTTQAIAGTGDFSNMENPGNFVEALRQSKSEDSKITVNFGPRVLSWRVDLNFSDKGVKDAVDKELRSLFRQTDFRLAISHALDRETIGQSMARGPFAYPYTGGFSTGSPYYDKASTSYQPFDQKKAMAMLNSLGLKDTDGDKILNMPETGENLTIDISFDSDRNDERKQLDAMTSQLAEVGIRVLPRGIDGSSFDKVKTGGGFNAIMHRVNFTLPTRESCTNLPVSDGCPYFNQQSEGNDTRQAFEKRISKAYEQFTSTNDAALQSAAIKEIQHELTDNAYSIGTVQSPAALLVNKRVKNAHPGTPVFMFEWAEDSVIRERLWIPKKDQMKELFKGVIAEYK